MRKLLFALALLLFAYLGVTYYLSSLILDTPNRDLPTAYRMSIDRWGLDLDSLAATLPDREEVTFTSEGLTLRAWYLAQDSADCGVVFSHGYSENRATMLKYAPFFARCGCDLLLYDHRGLGESDEAYASGGYHEATDLLAAHAYLRERSGLPDARIGWLGESWGAATALQAAGRRTVEPAWVVAESPFADWASAVVERGVKDYGAALHFFSPGAFAWVGYRNGMRFADASPLRAAPDIQVPVLLIHSLQDTLTAPGQSDRIAAGIRPDLLTYHRLDWGAWHAHNVIWRRAEYEGLLKDFVGDWCR